MKLSGTALVLIASAPLAAVGGETRVDGRWDDTLGLPAARARQRKGARAMTLARLERPALRAPGRR